MTRYFNESSETANATENVATAEEKVYSIGKKEIGKFKKYNSDKRRRCTKGFKKRKLFDDKIDDVCILSHLTWTCLAMMLAAANSPAHPVTMPSVR